LTINGQLEQTIDQGWGGANSPTCASQYFSYGVPVALDFKMALNDALDGITLPITGHSLTYMTTAISGWEWNDDEQDYDYVSYTAVNGVISAGAVTYTTGICSGDDYPGTLTMNASTDFIPDNVMFWVQDNGSYSN
jgi:hypothetical protein